LLKIAIEAENESTERAQTTAKTNSVRIQSDPGCGVRIRIQKDYISRLRIRVTSKM